METKLKKGLKVQGFKKVGDFILDSQIQNLEDFAIEMQYGKYIYYKDKVLHVSFVKGFGYSTIVEGIENGLFWTCWMEDYLPENKTFLERYAIAIMMVVGIVSWYFMFKFLLHF